MGLKACPHLSTVHNILLGEILLLSPSPLLYLFSWRQAQEKTTLVLKSSSAPAAASSFEDTDNAISCCVTATNQLLTVTDEQQGERCATSSGATQRVGDTSKDKTGFLTAGIRGKGWGESRSHHCSAITFGVRTDLTLTYTFPPSNHSSSVSLLPSNALETSCATFSHETSCLKTSFPDFKQASMPSPGRSFQVLRPRCCTSPFCIHFITGKQRPYVVISVRQCCHTLVPKKLMLPLGVCGIFPLGSMNHNEQHLKI